MKKQIYFILGLIFLLLAFIGILLPVLPTTPFALLAAYLFSQSSPRLHRWCLSLPILGPGILDWQNNRTIRPRAKILALSSIAVGGFFLWRGVAPFFLKVAVSFILVIVSLFIVTRKSGGDDKSNLKKQIFRKIESQKK